MKSLAFYLGVPVEGYTYSKVKWFKCRGWDTNHDFIQICFPTDEPSAFNPKAPILTEEEALIFRKSKIIRLMYCDLIAKYSYRILGCNGFYFSSSLFGANPKEPRKNGSYGSQFSSVQGDKYFWYSPGNHNMRRISRLIYSMRLIHIDDSIVNHIYESLVRHGNVLAQTYGDCHSSSLTHWDHALTRPLPW